MSVIFSVYSESAFKQYLLPAVNNTNASITLPKKIFGLDEDLELRLEVMDQCWSFPEAVAGYQISRGGVPYFGKILTDKDLISITNQSGKQMSLVVRMAESSFTVFHKIDISRDQRITIGKKEENTISYTYLQVVSRNHAALVVKGGVCTLEDSSQNGTFVNSRRIHQQYQLRYGDVINVFGLQMVYLGAVLAINDLDEEMMINWNQLTPYQPAPASVEEALLTKKPEKQYFHRAPRNIPKIETESIEIEPPPAPKPPSTQPLFMAIGPAMTMMLPMLMGSSLTIYSSRMNGSGGIFLFTGLITAVGSAVIGTFWALKNLRYAKKMNKEEENHRFEAYGEYLVHMTDTIRNAYNRNSQALHDLYPSAESYGELRDPGLLWNRNQSHKDFLTQRLGIGTLPFQMTINIPKERFNLINDSLADKPAMIQNDYKALVEVPVCVDLLEHQLLGVVGGRNKEGAMDLIRILTAQIAACDCYTDVKLAYIYDGTIFDSEEWEFARWLPHVWSEDHKTRYIASNKTEANEVLYEIANMIRNRAEGESLYRDKAKIQKPHYILIVANQEMLEGELISKYIYDAQPNYGITTLMMAENYEDLPNICNYIIENTERFKGMYSVTDGDEDKVVISFDRMSQDRLGGFARRLSGMEVKELQSGGEIPGSLTFFEMYGINKLEELKVENRWKKNRNYENMKSLIGQKAGGAPCYLDVHEKYHGPHGLVAGTTGSGKSETLQTYMLSLALNFSPDDIGFFIIDYKGGGMANLFSGLPHMIGQISNLSGNQVRRAMVSIKSENMRRQRIFNEHGVNNINLYTKLYKNNEASVPVPHLFIIIDEFAELKREEPDFMRELISVAQVGRSLGVHLILATQKPSGTVDDNIWSNSKFRLCLRVQDRQDSNDMLHKPDAAYLTQAGRSYLQVGNDELYELFQSGWSGAVYDEEQGAVRTEIAQMLSIDGKAAVVGSRLKLKQKELVRTRWISRLLVIAEALIESGNKSLENILLDSSALNLLIHQMFRELERQKLEYPVSEYNTRRIEDLLRVEHEANKQGVFAQMEDKAGVVIHLSEMMNKKLPEKKEKTQLDAVVEYLGMAAKSQGYTHNLQLWLPLLPTQLYLEDLEGYKENSFAHGSWPAESENWNLDAWVGLTDDPVNQAQMPLAISFSENGHHVICGTIVTGKSTFIQTVIYSLIRRYTPEHVNIYAIDFSSGMLSCFAGAAHVGGVMLEHDGEKVEKFFTMIAGILQERKKLFLGGNYSQYITVHGMTVPSIVVAIDNFANFKEKTENRFEESIMHLAKEGVNHGIFLLISSAGFGTMEIQSKIGDNMKTVLCLEMSNKFQYSEVLRTTHIDILPEADVKGRGLVGYGGRILEFQTAMALEAEDSYERMEKMKELCSQMNEVWSGKTAKQIPVIPENPVWSEFSAMEEVRELLADDRHLPIGYDLRNAQPYSVDLSGVYCYLISGKAHTGKTNLLRLLMMASKEKGGKLCVIDSASGELEAAAKAMEVAYITTERAYFEYFSALLEPFKKRNAYKRELTAAGLDDAELYEKMQTEEKYYIFINDLAGFVQKLYKPEDGSINIKGFLENITDKGRLHNVFFFACFNQDDWGKVTGLTVFDNMVRYKTGIHLGGNVSAQRIFNFDYLQYMEQSKTLKTGIGLLPVTEEEHQVERVVLPLARG